MEFAFLHTVCGCDNYGATVGKYSFLISRNEIGWTASFKDRKYTGKQSSSYIGDSLNTPFKTRQQAEAACRHKLKELKLN